MKKTWIPEKYRDILLAFGLSLGLMAAFRLFGVLVYDTNDDAIMASLSYGYYGTPEGKLIYINPALGAVLAFLQRTVPSAPWYYLAELGILGLSMAALYWLILKERHLPEVLPALAVLTVLLVQTELFRLQYTKISGCAAAAGMLLLFEAAQARRKWYGYLPGLLLALLGFCLRDTAFAMVLIPMAGVGLWQLAECWKRGERKQIGAMVLSFCTLFGICGGLHFVENRAYAGEDWQAYQRYNQLRTELMDYGFPEYEENRALYTSLGITEEDLALYKSWDFGDPERFNVETMEALCQAKERQTFSVRAFVSSGKSAVRGLMRYDFTAGLLMALLLAVVCGGKKRLPLILYEVLALFGTEAWLLYSGRGLRERVDGALVIAVCAVLLAVSRRNKFRELTGRGCALLALAVALSQVPSFLARKDDAMERYVGGAHLQSAYQVLAADTDRFYFTRTDELPADRLPGRQGGMGYYANIGQLGGWLTESPYVKQRNAAYGIRNPYRDLVDSDRILLMSNDIEPVLRYIRAYYAPDAQAVEVGSVRGEYSLWKFVSQ